MFYLTTHSTHFVYGYMASWHIVKDHSYSEESRCCNCMGTLFFLLAARVLLSFVCTIPYIGQVFVTPVATYWLEREIEHVRLTDKLFVRVCRGYKFWRGQFHAKVRVYTDICSIDSS